MVPREIVSVTSNRFSIRINYGILHFFLYNDSWNILRKENHLRNENTYYFAIKGCGEDISFSSR